MRLIDATRLVQLTLLERDKIPMFITERYGFGCQTPNKHGNSMRGGIRKVLRLIEQAPTIETVPVVHAKWTEDGLCSSCGNEASYTEWLEKTYDYDWDENLIESGEEVHRNHHLTEYCPRCGARMDGEADV